MPRDRGADPLGLAVNDTIHFLIRHKRERQAKDGVLPALRRTIDAVGLAMVANTAVGSYPQCAMQFSQRGSLPRPYLDQSVFSISSR